MASRLKSDTARTNGAKSHGPITPEGRAKSTTNSIRHGLTAKSVVLPTESTEEFQFLIDSHVDQFHPQTQVEMELVETMTVARWRLRRILTIETNLLHAEMVRHAEVIGRQSNNMDGDDRLARVFQKLANNGQSLALLVRYEGTLNRTYDRAFKHLHALQSLRNRPQPNEPKPDPTPADTSACRPAAPDSPIRPSTHSDPRLVAQSITDTTPVPPGPFSDS